MTFRRRSRSYNRIRALAEVRCGGPHDWRDRGVLRLFSVTNAGIAAPLLLLDVVVVARFWGLGPALFAAASGAAAYSSYFLPPEGFGIEDPDDWIAFVIFTGTAVIAGELASRAERRAAEAQAGRRRSSGCTRSCRRLSSARARPRPRAATSS